MRPLHIGRTVYHRPLQLWPTRARRKQSVAPFVSASFWLCIATLSMPPLFAEEPKPQKLTWRETWQGVDEAVRLFEEESYQEAADLFADIRERAPDGELDVDALRLMEATAHWNAGNPDATQQALEGYEELDANAMKVQKRQVLGSAQLALAQEQASQAQSGMNPESIQQANEQAEGARTSFESALKIDPASSETLQQLERTLKLLQELEEMEQQQQDQQQDQEQDQEDQEDSENQQEQENQESDQQDQQQQEPENQEQGQEEEEEQQDSSESEEQEESDESESSDDQESSEQNAQNQSGSPEDMQESEDLSEQQAQQLLQTYDEQERRQRRQFLQQRIRAIPVEKDW